MTKSLQSRDGLYKTRTVFAVELHPSTVANVEEGVKDQINTHLLRYVDEFEGVLLAYSNIEVLTKKPIIHPYFPYFHVDVRADVLVFKPAPGMNLVARVNHLGEDYIGALVLGVFNVTIPARSVMPDLRFLREENRWVHSQQPQHQIMECSYIVFKVQEVRDHDGFFQITGSMMDADTGAADFLFPNLQLPEPPAAAWEEDDEMEMVRASNGGDAAAGPAGFGKRSANGLTSPGNAEGGKERREVHEKQRKRPRKSLKATGQREGKRRKGEGAGPSAAAVPATAAAGVGQNGIADGAAGRAAADTHTDGKKHKGKHKDKDKGKDMGGKEDKNKGEKGAAVEDKGKSEKKDKSKDKEKVKEKDKEKKRKDGDKQADGKKGGMPATVASPSAPVTAAGGADKAAGERASGGKSSRPEVKANGAAEGVEAGPAPEAGGGSGKKKHVGKDRKEAKEASNKEGKEDKESRIKDGKEGKESSKKDGKESSKKSRKKA